MLQQWPWVKITERSSSTFSQTYTFLSHISKFKLKRFWRDKQKSLWQWRWQPKQTEKIKSTQTGVTEWGGKYVHWLSEIPLGQKISFLTDVLCILSHVSLAFQKEESMVTDGIIKLTEATLKLT